MQLMKEVITLPYNYSKLLGKMKEMGIRQEDLAKKIGINPASLNRKLHNDTQFKQSEIQKIMSTIGVPLDEVSAYFFTQYQRTISKNLCKNQFISHADKLN